MRPAVCSSASTIASKLNSTETMPIAIYLGKTGNFQPPGSLREDMSWFSSPDRYRFAQRFQIGRIELPIVPATWNTIRSNTYVGSTPEPCSGFQFFGPGGEEHLDNGRQGVDITRNYAYYQINQGRIGSDGQSVNSYLSHRNLSGSAATPWA